jgi:two-component system, OmpR family, phosphate regulon response regulator PhoB
MGVSVLLVEDEPKLQAQVVASLQQVGHRVICASSSSEADEALRLARPDVVLLELVLPGESGLSLLRRMRSDKRTSRLPMIVLSSRALEEDKILALEAGADDYVTKPFSTKELVARIEAVLRPMRRAEGAIEIAGLRLDPGTRSASAGERRIELGGAEFRLLHFLMSHPGRLYTREQLRGHVWGDEASIEERSIDVHVTRLRKALAVSGHHRLIRTVRGSGYILKV